MENQFLEYEDQIENEDDISPLWKDKIDEAVISGSDWTTETILRQIDKGNIILDPSFQRRSAWRTPRKSKFIESLILGLPIPQIVLAQSIENRGKYIVLDGKQRLMSIKGFTEPDNNGQFKQLKLKDLEIREDLNGKSFRDLTSDILYENDVSNFENQTIRTVIIKNWPNEDFLYNVFLRLNTGSVQLSPQELRQALHPGEFVQFAAKESETFKPLRDIFNSNEPDFRMRDAELLVRYFSFKYYIQEYSGNLKYFLDRTCEDLNAKWPRVVDQLQTDLKEFEKAHDYLKEIFSSNIYKKYTSDGYEKRFNRAIFDVFVYYFSSPKVRESTDKTKLKDMYQMLCTNNLDFLKSVEVTTKSIGATQNRLDHFGKELNKISKTNINIPKIKR